MDVCWLISLQLREIWRPNLDQEKVQSKCYHMASILATPLDHVRDHTPVYDHTLMQTFQLTRISQVSPGFCKNHPLTRIE